MLNLSHSDKEQLKNLTCDELIKALVKDGFYRYKSSSSKLIYIKETASGRIRMVIHYHPQKTYGLKLLIGLLEETGWDREDLIRLKLIKTS
jgi:predicted RNA binding protein YcfA (HicA-like mRNA interferase family)